MTNRKLKAYVQGEVIIREVLASKAELPPENKSGILATGETGQPHALVGGKFKLFGDALAANNYLEVIETTQLKHGVAHSGHELLELPPGCYEILPQREVDLLTRRARNVID